MYEHQRAFPLPLQCNVTGPTDARSAAPIFTRLRMQSHVARINKTPVGICRIGRASPVKDTCQLVLLDKVRLHRHSLRVVVGDEAAVSSDAVRGPDLRINVLLRTRSG